MSADHAAVISGLKINGDGNIECRLPNCNEHGYETDDYTVTFYRNGPDYYENCPYEEFAGEDNVVHDDEDLAFAMPAFTFDTGKLSTITTPTYSSYYSGGFFTTT